ncbi:MAG: glycosyltransferase family 2 protein [Proteobacteria bacterium]|nr:glycosyltransferase family 2 protein [Pseudomonadota bacterium]
MKTPVVSVIIPTLNSERTLAAVLDGLARQTLAPDLFEVVVVDDGSSDGTPARIAAARFPFALVYKRLERESDAYFAARPRNAGLRAARGRVAVFLDSDILPVPGLLSAHLSAHPEGAPARAAVGTIFDASAEQEGSAALPPLERAYERLPELLRGAPPAWLDRRTPMYERWPRLQDAPIRWTAFWTGNVSVPREAVLAAGGFNESTKGLGREDTDLGFRLFKRGVEFVRATEAQCLHWPQPRRAVVHSTRPKEPRHLLRFHPDVEMELALWFLCFSFQDEQTAGLSWEARLDALEDLRARVDGVKAAAAAPTERARAVAAWAASLPRGCAWFGPADWAPAAAVRSDIRSAAESPRSHALAGIASGLEPGSFPAAVAAEYWTELPPAAVRALARELTRLSERARFVRSASRGPDLSEMLGSGFDTVREDAPAGVIVETVRRRAAAAG